MGHREEPEVEGAFRYEGRPGWLESLEAEPGYLSERWAQVLAHVARHGNESGLFLDRSPEWADRSGLDYRATRALAAQLVEAGALTRSYGRFYVAGWRETYRRPG